MPSYQKNIVGVILAGGLSRRMNNQNKSFISLANKPLLEHVLERFSPQCDTLIVNSNEQSKQLSSYQLPIVKDTLKGFLGPLSGVLSAMEWSRQHQPEAQWVVTVPVDTPFLPVDLVSTLYQSVQENNAEIACACSNERTHPVVGIWSISLLDDLRLALTAEGIRKIDFWTSRHNISHQNFSHEIHDPFFNINSKEDLIQAEALLK